MPDPRAVSVTIPADAEHIVVARTTVAAAAAVAGATLDEVEDLRLAVSEACSLLLDGAELGTVTVTAQHAGAHLDLSFSTDGVPAGERPGSDLAWTLLEGLVDEVHWAPGGPAPLALRKLLALGDPAGP